MQVAATLPRNQAVVLSLGGLVCRRPKEESTLRKNLQRLVREWNGPQVDGDGFATVAHPERDPFMVSAQVFVQPHFAALSLYLHDILDHRQLLRAAAVVDDGSRA